MDITVENHPLRGTIDAMFSKSHVHRAMICAALADGPTVLRFSGTSADIEATERCLTALGARFVHGDGCVTVTPGTATDSPLLDCGESGSTLRFLLPMAAALGANATFTGGGRLGKRPLEPLLSRMREHGVLFSEESLPLTLSGKLIGGRFDLPGDVSSQYITGLLLALPLVGGGEVHLTTPLQSAGYVEMTQRTMAAFGIAVERTKSGFLVPDGGYRSPGTLIAEGDWSNAAFWLCAGALSGPVTVTGLDQNSAQGDRAILDILRAFGAEVSVMGDACTVSSAPLHGIELDAGDIPDLIPVVSVTAACAEGDTVVRNVRRLRLKESDRLTAIVTQLTALGGRAETDGETLIIHGGGLRGGVVSSENDHRMVMSTAVAAVGCSCPVTIRGAEAVAKSYPDFFSDLLNLGGATHG